MPMFVFIIHGTIGGDPGCAI